jgi:hypothetical protein
LFQLLSPLPSQSCNTPSIQIKPAIRVKVNAQNGAKERDCYINVRDKIQREGYGRMLLGWAVWQHAHLFIEGEAHAVFDPGNGRPLVDCTPHKLPDGQFCREILFIPNEGSTYDFNTTDVMDNVRVPLVDDPRVTEALRLFSKRVALLNSVPEIGIEMPPHIARQIFDLQARASLLLTNAMAPKRPPQFATKIGRNDPCPCGNGKKYKKCHGSQV